MSARSGGLSNAPAASRILLPIMGFVALTGMGSGALHALAGPDHLISLAPLSVSRRRGAWRIGLLWGAGHALGSLAAAVVMMVAVSAAELEGIDRWAEALAGVALIGMGVIGLRRRISFEDEASVSRGVFAVGLLHGVTGAAGLMLLLPGIVSGELLHRAVFLGGFSLGSTVAMAALTAGIALLARGRRVPAAVLTRVPKIASGGSILLGGAWVFAAL